MHAYPLIFLDIDGVLRSTFPTVQTRRVRGRTIMSHNPECVHALNWLTDASGAKLVISSTWRSSGIRDMRQTLADWRVTGEVISLIPPTFLATFAQAPHICTSYRGEEIHWWLKLHAQRRGHTPRYVILDDEDDAMQGMPRVMTDHDVGLTMADAKEALRLLKAQG